MQGREGENECSICLAVLDKESDVVQLQCNHRFHARCIREWIKTAHRDFADQSCPNCRKPIIFQHQQNTFPNQRYDIVMSRFAQVHMQDRMSQNNNFLSNDNSQQIIQPNPGQQNSDDCSKVALFVVGFIALAAEGLIIYFYISSCGELFVTNNDLPIFDAGMNAKGYIAIGMWAQGIVAIGMVGQGIFTVSMVGTGLLCFFGQLGGGFGLGLYQIGISWFCRMGQLSIGLWYTQTAQMGVSLISPFFYPQRKHMVTCQ